MTDEHAVHSLFDALGGEACRAHAVSACPTRPARRLLSTQGPSGLAALLAGSPTAHSELFRVDRRAAVHMLRNMLQSLPWPSTRSTRTHAACAACALPALLVLLVAPARCSRGSPPPRPPQGANTLKLLLELLTVTCWSFSPAAHCPSASALFSLIFTLSSSTSDVRLARHLVVALRQGSQGGSENQYRAAASRGSR